MTIWVENLAIHDFRGKLERISNFFNRQIEQITKGGLFALLQKLFYLFLLALALPFVIVIRLLRPLVLIRFGIVDSQRIGYFLSNIELYLCEQDAGMHRGRKLDFFYFSKGKLNGQQLGKMWKAMCNEQLGKMIKRTVRVFWFFRWVDRANHIFPGWKAHSITFPPGGRDIYNLLERFPMHVAFTAQEEKRGCQELKNLGILERTPFVCLIIREAAYLNALDPKSTYDHFEYMNVSIKNFINSTEELVSRGYKVVRMGAVVNGPLETKFAGIIDYACTARSEFLDIFLSAKCCFCFGSPTGIATVPMMFRRPLALTNFVPLEIVHTWSSNELFIPKKLWLKDEHRFLTFREMIKSGASRFLKEAQYTQLGLEIIENTPEENTGLAVEMDERLKGRWVTTKEDEELQQRFWEIFPKSELHGEIKSRIGAEFLRQNRELLE